MAKAKFTAGRVADYRCEEGKKQSFLWDAVVPSLAIRATIGGAKAYIFQGRLDGQVIRITIGSPSTWTIDAAQAEARRLQVMVDNGQDPRQVKSDIKAAAKAKRDDQVAAQAALVAQEARDSITLGNVWPKYVADRVPHWSTNTLLAHQQAMQAGGEQDKCRPRLTVAGPLHSLATTRLVDLTQETIEEWAEVEGQARPSSARLALRLLSGGFSWGVEHKTYKILVTSNAANSKKAREALGSPKKRNDVLSREQLAAWFAAVRQIGNPVASAYLQTLLLTGARRRELSGLRWADVDFQWDSLKLADKVEDFGYVTVNCWTWFMPNTADRNAVGDRALQLRSINLRQPR